MQEESASYIKSRIAIELSSQAMRNNVARSSLKICNGIIAHTNIHVLSYTHRDKKNNKKFPYNTAVGLTTLRPLSLKSA